MSDTKGTQENQKAAKIRRKPERDSVLTPTFAAAQHSTSVTILDRNQQGSGLLQRQCACGTHTIGGGKCYACRQKRESSFLKRTDSNSWLNRSVMFKRNEAQAFLQSGSAYDFSHIPVHTSKLSAIPATQTKPYVNTLTDQWSFNPNRKPAPLNTLQTVRVSGSDQSGDTQSSLSNAGNTIVREAGAHRIIVALPQSDGRYTLIPPNPNGRTLYFFYGYNNTREDRIARAREAPHIADDVVAAAARGFHVVYDEAGTLLDFGNALYDPNCYGIYWSGHGGATEEGQLTGRIWTSDDQTFGADNVNPDRVSPNLRFLILAACGSGVTARQWQRVLPAQCRFEGWEQLTTSSEGVDFTSTALVGDSWVSHGGMHPDLELPDYINYATER